MVQINWQDEALEVRRIVLSREMPVSLSETILRLAASHGVAIADECVAARGGDLWIACLPEKGWGEASTRQIGWVRGQEVQLVIAQLRHARPTLSAG
jgi:hypothetical protein